MIENCVVRVSMIMLECLANGFKHSIKSEREWFLLDFGRLDSLLVAWNTTNSNNNEKPFFENATNVNFLTESFFKITMKKTTKTKSCNKNSTWLVN